MHSNITFALLLLGLVAIQALPTEKAEQSSLKQEDLKIEEAAEDKDRSKKSILCLESASLLPQQPVQTLNLQPAPVQTFAIQSAPVQTLSIQQAPQLKIQPVQTLSLQPVPQPIQTLNLIQPPPAVHASTTTVIAQPQKPCPQAEKIVERVEVKVENTPKVETISKPEKIVKPKPHKVKVEEEESDPMVLIHTKPVMVMAEPEPMSFVKVPHCHQCQQSLMQCSCRPQAAMRSMMAEPHMHFIGVKERGMRIPMVESMQSGVMERF